MRSDIVPGGTFPDNEVPDHTRTPRRLSEIQGDGRGWNRESAASTSAV